MLLGILYLKTVIIISNVRIITKITNIVYFLPISAINAIFVVFLYEITCR